eukprot:2664575-Prymnesium_polylepis.2
MQSLCCNSEKRRSAAAAPSERRSEKRGREREESRASRGVPRIVRELGARGAAASRHVPRRERDRERDARGSERPHRSAQAVLAHARAWGWGVGGVGVGVGMRLWRARTAWHVPRAQATARAARAYRPGYAGSLSPHRGPRAFTYRISSLLRGRIGRAPVRHTCHEHTPSAPGHALVRRRRAPTGLSSDAPHPARANRRARPQRMLLRSLSHAITHTVSLRQSVSAPLRHHMRRIRSAAPIQQQLQVAQPLSKRRPSRDAQLEATARLPQYHCPSQP